MQMGNYRFSQDLAMEWGEKILIAVAILLVTWALAKAAKWAFARLVDNVKFLQRDTSSGESVGQSLGKIVSLLIWLFGLLAILQVFALSGVIQPVQTLLNNIMVFIPGLIGAALVFFLGLVIARIARDLTVTTLQTVDLDKWANRGGVDEMTGSTALSRTIGTIVYVVIVIFFSIAALNILSIEAISDPATNMLQLIFDAIPRIIGAAIILGLGYLISKFVVQILKEVLPGLGVDRALDAMEIIPSGTSASGIIARVSQIAIILFFAIAATRLLGFPELTAILDQILELGGRVIFGAVVIAVGFLIATLLAKIIAGTDDTELAPTIVRYATIVLFVFMGLQFMGVGEEIVELAFGALVVGTAVAGALAFGLGGREPAKRMMQRWTKSGNQGQGGPGKPPQSPPDM